MIQGEQIVGPFRKETILKNNPGMGNWPDHIGVFNRLGDKILTCATHSDANTIIWLLETVEDLKLELREERR